MSENSEFEAEKLPASEPGPAVEGDRIAESESRPGSDSGQYVDGDYGKAGTAGSNLVTADDAEYPDGDYGRAGTTGKAGSTPGTTAAAAAGGPAGSREGRLVDDEVDIEGE